MARTILRPEDSLQVPLRPAFQPRTRGRRHGLDLERAVYLRVLHRLFAPGSDRAADRWRERRAPGRNGNSAALPP